MGGESYSVSCSKNEQSVYTFPCAVESSSFLSIQCRGHVEVLTRTCPMEEKEIVCARLIGNKFVPQDGGCTVVELSNGRLVCSCPVFPQSLSRRRMLFSNESSNPTGSFTVTFAGMVKATVTNFENTVSTADNLDKESLVRGEASVLTLGSLLFAFFSILAIAYELDRRDSRPKPKKQDKLRSISPISPVINVRSQMDSLHRLTEEALPSILKAKSLRVS